MSIESGFTPEFIAGQTSKPNVRREPSRDEAVAAKVEAIRRQSPKMTGEEIRLQAEDEVDAGLKIWGTLNIGPKQYNIEGESKEVMEKWERQIREILEKVDKAIEDGDFTGLVKLLGENFHEHDLSVLVEKIKMEAERFGQELGDEAKKLLSIGLWLWREQGGAWAGERKTIWRILTKDSASLSSFLDKAGAPSCIDTSFLIKALADQMGIAGDVKKIDKGIVAKITFGKMAHRYFQTDSGKVMDYWWSRGTAGLKMNPTAYTEIEEKKSGSHLCGK